MPVGGISDRLLIARRTAFACCAAQFDAEYTQELIFGDKACAARKKRLSLAYWWAADVMNHTALSTEDENCQCVTHLFACQVIRKMDPGCVVCGCGNKPIQCTIEPDYTVYQAVDAGFQSGADPALAYLIVSDLNGWGGTWAQHVGEVVQGTTFTLPIVGSIILDAVQAPFAYNTALWVRTSSGVGLLFPRFDASLNGTTLSVLSRYPPANALLQRDILIEVSTDATIWIGAYVGNEAGPIPTLTVDPATIYIRTTYFYEAENQCQTEPLMGEIPPPVELRLSINFSNDDAGQAGLLVSQTTSNTITDIYTQTQWTLASYLKASSAQSFFQLFQFLTTGIQNVTEVYLNGGSFQWLMPGGGTISAPFNFFDNTWHHLAITKNSSSVSNYTNGTVKIYVDGLPKVVTGGANLSIQAGQTLMRVGSPVFGTPPFAGYVHMCEIYACNTERSQSDIQNILMTGTAQANDATWGRTLYIPPLNSDTPTLFATNGAYTIATPPLPLSYIGAGVTLIQDNPLP